MRPHHARSTLAINGAQFVIDGSGALGRRVAATSCRAARSRTLCDGGGVNSARTVRQILWFDGGGGLIAGAVTLALVDWLATLYQFAPGLVLFIAAANLLYGAYSTTLARRAGRGQWPSRRAVDVLIVANAAWAVVCLGLLLATWRSASAFGSIHVALEGGYLAALAAYEWRVLRPALRAVMRGA